MFSHEVEELGGVGAVGDFVIHRQRHIHQLADHDVAIIGYARLGDLANA